MTRTDKSKMPARVLKELSDVLLRALEEFRPDGKQLTEQEKKYALNVIEGSPAFQAIAKKVQAGTDSDLKQAEETLRKQSLPELRKLLMEAGKKLPHYPGGRKASLTEEQKIEVCRKIGELMGNGAQLKDAVTRVAQSLGVSQRTIYRAWDVRASLKKQAPPDGSVRSR